MTTKQYVTDIQNNLDTQIAEKTKFMGRRSFLYNLGSIFSGVLGVCLLMGDPWFAVPFIAVAGGLQMGKRVMNETTQAEIKNLTGQRNNINTMLTKGLNVDPVENSKRGSKLKGLKSKFQHKVADMLSAKSKYNFANFLVAGTTALAWFISNPILAFVPIACLGIKKLADDKYIQENSAMQDANQALNDSIHTYNIVNMVNARKQANASKTATNTKTQTNTNTRQKQAVAGATKTPQARYSRADEEAVNAYVNSLGNQTGEVKGVQKRKI